MSQARENACSGSLPHREQSLRFPGLERHVRVEPDKSCLSDPHMVLDQPPGEHGTKIRGAHAFGGVRVINADQHVYINIWVRSIHL